MKTNLYQPLLVILALIGMIEISSCAVEQEASIPRDGTVLSGSYALDNGTGLTNTYLTFTNGKIYEYTCSSTVVFAEGYLWNVSSRDFSLRYSGECSISDGTLYRDGIPCGRLKISENTLVLNEVIYRKYNGFKSGRYSVIKIEGSSLRTINYQEQEIEIQVSVSKTIPSGVLRAQVDADWLYLRSNDNGKFSFFAREFDAASTNSSRSGKITFYYPGTENRQMTIQQNRQNTSLNITSSTQNINETGGTYSIDYSINDPINGVFLLASSQSDWISDIAVNNNQINYSVSPLLGSIPSRVGVIECKYGEKIVVDIFVSQEWKWVIDSSVANCYIVSTPGTYNIKTVFGNSTKTIEGIASASALWESYGTSTTPSVGSIVKDVSYSTNTITFSTPSTLKNGNAVIAAKDASGNILWSWHIWVCKGYDPNVTAQEYYNSAGVMMDRNLGATSATPGSVGALGLLYQWGRKDPFLGSSSISSNTKAASTLSWPSAVSSNSSNGTIAYAVKNPTTFIMYNSNNYDWYYSSSSSTDNTRWQSTKTIYDPCPPGWKIPTGGSSGVWSKAANTSRSFSHTWNSTNKGMNYSGKFGSASAIWYPAAGYLATGGGSLSDVGSGGSWWSCTPYGSYAYYLRLRNYDYGNVYPSDGSLRASGYSVRCLQE